MVDEVDIGKVRVGQKATFTVDSFPAREFPGKVVAIYPDAVLLENVVYYDVVIEIQRNEDKVLRPQMTASATDLPGRQDRRSGDSRQGGQTRTGKERGVRDEGRPAAAARSQSRLERRNVDRGCLRASRGRNHSPSGPGRQADNTLSEGSRHD